MNQVYVNGVLHESFMPSEVDPDDKGHKRVQIIIEKPSKTDQSFKDDCDVNLMVKRFTKSNGINNSQFLAYMSKYSPGFDQTSVVEGTLPDYELYLNSQIEAESMFMSLPSSIRTKFDNDPARFLDFVGKSENRLELARMGLLQKDIADKLIFEADSAAARAAASTTPSGSSGS